MAWAASEFASSALTLRLQIRSSATNRLIEAKDKASVQINIGHVNGTPPRHVWILCTAHALPPRSSPFWRRAPLRCGSKACGTLIPSRSVTPPCARSRRTLPAVSQQNLCRLQ